jgi:tyrosine-specific transport protein
MSSLGDGAIRNASLALTLVPPLIFTTRGDPSSFISALSLAGGYGMTLLYGILPPMMAFVNRREEGSGRLLVGGETPLFFLGACGLGFFGLRLAEDVLHVF